MKRISNLFALVLICSMAQAVDTTVQIKIRGASKPSVSTDAVYLIQAARYSAAKDTSDTEKLMNPTTQVSVWAISPTLGNLSTMQTNQLVGTYIGFHANANTNYTMTFDPNWLQGETLYLKDWVRDTVFAMTASMSYPFSVATASTTYSSRFQIVEPTYLYYHRDVANGNWATVCFPYKFLGKSGAEGLYQLTAINSAGTKVALDVVELTDVEAGKPYFFRSDSAAQEFKYLPVNMASKADSVNGLIGTFVDIPSTPWQKWVLTGNTVTPAAVGSIVPQYRCYIDLDLTPVDDAVFNNPVPVPGRLIFNVKNTPDALQEVNASENANGKMIIDGQFVIVKDGKMFNAQGVRL